MTWKIESFGTDLESFGSVRVSIRPGKCWYLELESNGTLVLLDLESDRTDLESIGAVN